MTEADEGRGFVLFVSPRPPLTPPALLTVPAGYETAVAKPSCADADLIQQALSVLESRMRTVGPLLSNPQVVRDFLCLKIADLEHAVFLCLFLDVQHRL